MPLNSLSFLDVYEFDLDVQQTDLTEAGLFNKSLFLARALGVTKFQNAGDLIFGHTLWLKSDLDVQQTHFLV